MSEALLAIYPTARKVEDQLKRLSQGGGLLGHRLTTLPQLADGLWFERRDRRASLSATGERLVILEAIARARRAGATADLTEGMVDRLLALIHQLKSSALMAEDWRAACDAIASGERARLTDSVAIFTAYEELLAERGLVDRHDRERGALDLLLRAEVEGTRPWFLEGVEKLLVAEIYDLSLIQFMTIAALIRIVGDAELTIQAEPHRVDATRFADLTWNRFVGEESIADQVLPDFVRRGGREGRLGFLLEQVFTSTSPLPPPLDDTVTIIEAHDARAEAEAVARAIRQLLEREDQPTAPARIAVLARDLAAHGDYLAMAFQRYRIPLALEAGPRLRASAPARALLEILRLPLEGYRRDALIALCDAPFISTAAARYRDLPREVGYIDQATRPLADCIARRRQELAAAIAASDGTERERYDRQLARVERGAVAFAELLDAVATIERAATLPDHLERLRTLVERLNFDPLADSLVDAAAVAAGALERSLDELAGEGERVAPERSMSLAEFVRLLEAVLSEGATTSPFAEGGAVAALPLMDARGLDFDQVFIVGLNEGSFPRYQAEDPLLPETILPDLNRALRSALRRRMGSRAPSAPGPLLRSRGQRNSEEAFLFFLGLSMPARGIVLSYAREDEGGGPLARSSFLNEVLRVLPDTPVHTAAIAGIAADVDCFAERDFLNRAAAASASARTESPRGLPPARLASIRRRVAIEAHREDYLAMPTRGELFAERRRGRRRDAIWIDRDAILGDPIKESTAGPFDGRVGSDPRLREMLLEGSDGAPVTWSATRLTDLATCGFRFFASRILRLRDAEEADHEQTNLETGELAHGLLSDFFDTHPNFGDPQAARALARAVAARWRVRGRGDARDPAFFDANWVTVAAMLDEVVEYEIASHGGGDQPAKLRHEHQFGLWLDAPETTSRGPLRVRLEGRIDRLELYENAAGQIERLRVVDYKASRGLKRLKDLLRPDRFATIDLQMALYLMAAVDEHHARLAPSATAEAAYIALKRREKVTAPLSVERALLDPVNCVSPPSPEPLPVPARILDLVADALAGKFDVDPLECSDFCPYRPVCRYTKGSA